MSITDKIRKALESIDIENYYIERGNEKNNCIVYTYSEFPDYYADNKEKSVKYTVLLNLYTLNSIEKYKKLVNESMIKEGFIRKSVASTMKDATGFFNTPFIFEIRLRNEE